MGGDRREQSVEKIGLLYLPYFVLFCFVFFVLMGSLCTDGANSPDYRGAFWIQIEYLGLWQGVNRLFIASN